MSNEIPPAASAGPQDPRSPAPPGRRLPYVPRLWFGVSEPVHRAAYAASGFSLMLVKYGVEALAIWNYTAASFAPWDFLNPLLSVRLQILSPGPEWLPWAIFAWTLPFLWISISMSVRRAADAGASPWLGLMVLIPLINLLVMLILCFLPSQGSGEWSPYSRPASHQQQAKSAALAIGISLLLGGFMLVSSVYVLETYGASLFLGAPLLMGAVAGYVFNQPHPRGYGASGTLGLTSVFFAGLALLLFALEGLICVAMALPLLLPLGALGGLMGKAIADSTRRPHGELLAAVILLPMWAGAESLLGPVREYEVLTAVEIDAPPEVAWRHVVEFPDLPEPSEWYFRLGIACPERARIEGAGAGATRYCDFSTGTFVEPITAWEEPWRLAFDVTQQPPPMTELSFYRHVHPPHLQGYLRSSRGEFRLVPLAGGRTRLEGRSWYELHMFPQGYWTLWTDLLIHRIHERVLLHIKRLSESQQRHDRTSARR